MGKISIPKTWKTINDQNELIQELTIALWLIEHWSTSAIKNTWANIMFELMNRPIEEPANRLDAMRQAKLAIKNS